MTISDGHGAIIQVPVAVAVSPAPPLVTFNFVYGTGSQYWTTNARNALQAAADILSSALVVSAPVTLSYRLIGTNSPTSGTLASAFAYFSSGQPGFHSTVVQKKVLTGIDANGAAANGQITWNFGYSYWYGDSDDVMYDRYDFTGVALHELLHTFGIISGIGDPSNPDTNLDHLR